MKKVLIISGSPRRGGNSERLCEEFAKGARESGNDVEFITLRGKEIGFCRACDYCMNHGRVCCVKDDVAGIIAKMKSADVLVLASPVYFYAVDAQMKALIDRVYCVWDQPELMNKEFYYLMSAGETDDWTMDGTLECFRGFAKCLEGSREMGHVSAMGLYEVGAIEGTEYLEQAYSMGRSIH